MKNKDLYLLKDAPISKALILLSIPSILTSLVNTLHNLIDTIYISQLQNNAMIAATTVALPISVIISSLGDLIGAGSGSYLGRMLGSKNDKNIKATVSTSITLTCLFSLVVFIYAFTLLKPSIQLFTDDPDVLNHTYDYLKILTMLSFFTISKQVLSYLLRSYGDVNFPMKAIILSILLNVLLNPIFMFDFGFGLKIKGAAIATMIAEGVAAIMMFYRLIHRESLIQWKVGDFGLDKTSLNEIFMVGLPAFIRNSLSSFAYGFFAKSAGLFGTEFVAAAGIARKGEYLARCVIMGLAQGYQPFAAFNYGARNKKRLLEAMKSIIIFGVGYGILIGSFFYFFPHLFMGMMTSDQNLIELGKDILIGYAFAVPVVVIYQIFATNFQSMGKGKLSFFSSLLRQGFVYCPLVYILPRLFGTTGFMFVQPLCDWISTLIVILLSRPIFKEIQEM